VNPVSVGADERGFSLPSRPDQVLDVYLGERRVFSVAPTAFEWRDGRAHAEWPGQLRQFLKGHARLVVKQHLTGAVLLDEAIQIGECTEAISVTDRQGLPLTIDKFGGLSRTFAGTGDSAAAHLAGEIARLVHDVNAFGVPGFLAFGSLLGAVRNGKLIAHDTDADVAYLSAFDHPSDVARESFALERFLVGRGWTMQRMRVGLIRAVLRDQAGDTRHIDIFIAVDEGGTHLFLDRFFRAELPRSVLVPLSTVTLEGVEIPAPAEPGALLAATYGPSYLTPDPSFAYRTPRSVRRKALAWLGDYRLYRAYWQRKYRRRRGRPVPPPSELVKSVAAGLPRDATVVDVGCGRAGDVIWLAAQGYRVIGIDYANTPLMRARTVAKNRGLTAEFRRLSLYDVRSSLAVGARLAAESDELTLMSRNLLDVLLPEGRTNFWLLCRTALLHGGTLHLRFRTHPRGKGAREAGMQTLDPDVIEAEARARGARVVSRHDEPRSTVLVLTWQQES
jgi:SAM-dependent methyltransferase